MFIGSAPDNADKREIALAKMLILEHRTASVQKVRAERSAENGYLQQARISCRRICKQVALVAGLLASLGACAPKPFLLGKTPDGPPIFKQGWEDGCESGLATISTTYYKSFYKFKQDVTLVTNNIYFDAWQDAFAYCRDYTDRWAFDTWDNLWQN